MLRQADSANKKAAQLTPSGLRRPDPPSTRPANRPERVSASSPTGCRALFRNMAGSLEQTYFEQPVLPSEFVDFIKVLLPAQFHLRLTGIKVFSQCRYLRA